MEDNVYVDSSIVNTENVKNGDIIVVVRNGSRELLGKHAQIKYPMSQTVIGAFMSGIRYKNPDFLNILLSTKQFNEEINKNLGATINQITTGNFKKMEFYFPNSTDEEVNVGKLFLNIDNLIAFHQRKYDALLALKEALMDKMFPEFEFNVPKLRFLSFKDDWINANLGTLGVFKSNGVDKKINPDEIWVNLLNYMDVYKRKPITNKNCTELMQVTAKENKLVENNVLKGDVFFTPTSETPDDIGRVMVIEENLDNTVYSYHLMRYRPYDNVFHCNYPNYGFSYKNIRSQMYYAAQGVQRYVINKNDFENLNINYPTIDEQEKITTLLTNVDNLITLHQRKLKKLQDLKKALSEKMFL